MRIALSIIAVAAFAAVPFIAPWLQFVLTMAIANGLAALGVAILLRAGLITIGHAMFFAVSAYAVAFMARAGVSDLGLLLLGGVSVTVLSSALVGAFVVRYRAIFFAMLNLAISMVFFSLLAKLYGVTGGTDGLRVPVPTLLGMVVSKAQFDTVLFYTGAAIVFVVGFCVQRYLHSPLGHALSAVHTNEIRLEYLGIPVWLVLLIAYVISAALAGLGGAIAGLAIGHVLPELAFWTHSGHLVLVAVLGGIGGFIGPFVGAIFLELLHTITVSYTDSWNMITGVALICVIMFLPAGLYSLLQRKRTDATGEVI